MSQNFSKYILTFFIFVICWFWGLPFIFARTVPLVCENISYNSDFSVQVENPQLRLYIIPVAKISAEKLVINSKTQNLSVFLDYPEAKIRLLPLLSAKLHINKAGAETVVVTSKLKHALSLNKDFLEKMSKSRIKCDEIYTEKFDIAVWQEGVEKPAIYKGKHIEFENNFRYLKLNLESCVDIQGKVSEIIAKLYLPKNNDIEKSIIDVTVSNLNMAHLGEYLKYYLPQDLKFLKGSIDIDVDKKHLDIVLKDCAVIMQDSAKSMIFPQKLTIDSDFKLSSKEITLDNMEIKSDKIFVNISGKISDYLEKQIPAVNLAIQINKSRIEDIVKMLPPFKTEDIDAYKLKKYGFWGDVIGNITVKGNNLEPSINGAVYINNGVLIKPIQNTSGAVVKLNFAGKYLNYDVYVPASATEKVWVKGGVELYNVKYADMRVWSTKNVDLSVAEEKVVPLHEILNFVVGPVPIMDIKGLGNIDITIKGNRKNPHIWGVLNVNNVTTHFYDMPDLILTNADADLVFDDENSVFTIKKGLINGSPVDIKGTCNVAGKFDFDVSSKQQELSKLYNAIKTSSMIDDIKNIIPDFETINGLIGLKLKVYGNIKDFTNTKFNENFFVKGKTTFLGNNFGLQGINITNTSGTLDFDGTNAKADFSSHIGNSPLTAKALIKGNNAALDLSIPYLNLADVALTKDRAVKDFGNIIVDVKSSYNGKTSDIEYDKLNFYAKVLGSAKGNKLDVSNGEIILKNGHLNIKNINGKFADTKSAFGLNMQIDDIAARPNVTGDINLKEFELSLINKLCEYSIIPSNIRENIKKIQFEKGKINLKASISHNSINASTNLGGIVFRYIPSNLAVQIVDGSLYAKKDYIGLNKINILADNMPILLDGSINNIFSKQNFDLYMNSKPQQDFVDKYINNHRIFPLKLKGDIVCSLKLKGTKNDYNVNSVVNMEKDSSIYYLGAAVGDIENAIVLNLNMQIIKQNLIKIKEFSYDKLIASQGQRKTKLNMLKADGGIELLKDDIIFRELHIKTNHPTDARIFNIIFRKPNIKQGQFKSDLRLSGKLSNPRVTGSFHIFETNIPFFETTMKNITLIFKEKTIEISSSGEIMGNDVNVKATLKNKLTRPFYVENATLETKILDLNKMTEKIKLSQLDENVVYSPFDGFNLRELVIKRLKLTADEIRLRNLVAQDVGAIASFNEKSDINIENFNFKIANGNINGKFLYNLNDNNSEITMKVKDIDANDITYAVFDLNNQIYGNLTGDIWLSCDGTSFNKCMTTLNGSTTFNVSDGRMPKLGSLEYLLRAGNLVKGGITGLSINSVIDILTPLKTGDFSNIYGKIDIKNGIAENIEIATRGKDLSLFITGNYNFGTSIADMEVLGMLSKKISTMFGPLGNVSLNTLFNIIPGVDLSKDSNILNNINKIPGIELSNKAFRKFIAIIKGNINGEDYVSSFEWIN